MKLNLLIFCLISGLTPIFGAPEMEKKAAANSLDTSPAAKSNGDVLADGMTNFLSLNFPPCLVSIFVEIPELMETSPLSEIGSLLLLRRGMQRLLLLRPTPQLLLCFRRLLVFRLIGKLSRWPLRRTSTTVWKGFCGL
ncbi:predicted protein [Histoplasma capsulatum G186AR]|uniref:Uncharacterized protein n=1 Tax=Ajellomyces capsulatus (strain G186AR / H82 / ATCC MYA-2454 / RMSCC 2432) TaxID=447093 RepID=C0NX11_AJECG|nr:uncharacterized protein HCBG_08003 [Histoplasma capsulatum G186AR]EEH03877.1 predicted protein [Histoplasma capsulatum G186AR]